MCEYCGPSSLRPRWNLIKIMLWAWLLFLAALDVGGAWEQPAQEVVGEALRDGLPWWREFLLFFRDNPTLGLAILAAAVLIFGQRWRWRR